MCTGLTLVQTSPAVSPTAGHATPSPLLCSPPTPSYPFELVVADYFNLYGHDYLVYADIYTGWVSIKLCSAFGIYSTPIELALDGRPQLAARHTQQFLCTWGVTWPVSSSPYLKSNGRAELAVKTVKDYVSTSGDLNTDVMVLALQQ